MQNNVDSVMSKAESLVVPQNERNVTQNKEPGGGGGAYYGLVSSTSPKLDPGLGVHRPKGSHHRGAGVCRGCA